MLYKNRLLFFAVLLLGLQSCLSEPSEKPSPNLDPVLVTQDSSIGYNFQNATAILKLPLELREISGLCWYQNKTLLAIEDEDAIIYALDSHTGKIQAQYPFGQPGDYEGITCVGDTIYCLHALGELYKIPGLKQKAQRIPLQLHKQNNPEGLCYDAQTRSLLIACKGSAGLEQEIHNKRSIYAYRLDSNFLEKRNRYKLSKKKIKKYLKTLDKQDYSAKKLKKVLNKSKHLSIHPSGIAIHPVTGDIYIIAAAGNTLLVLNREKKVILARYIPKKQIEQAEGICFNAQGDLFIASEGHEQAPKIHRFNYLANQ